MALPPRAPAAASESSEAKLASPVAARDLKVAYAHTRAGGSSSSSGTSWTTYTSSGGSVLPSELGLQLLCIDDEETGKRLERAKRLAKELCHGDGDMAALERWLSEMGVGWVVHLADDPSAGTILLRAEPQRSNLTERWILALSEITEFIRLEYIVRRTDVPPPVPRRVQLFWIFEAAVLKMLPFVDALLAAANLDATTDTADVTISNAVQASFEKLQTLLGVRDALSSASGSCFVYQDSSPEMAAQQSKLLNLLSEKEARLDEAIWNTMEEVRTGILTSNDDDDNKWGIQTCRVGARYRTPLHLHLALPRQTWRGPPGICKATRSLVTYIEYLWGDYWRLNRIVRAAAELGNYVPNRDVISTFLLSADQDNTSPLITLQLEMVSSLEVKLAKRSESFSDHSLRLLFLINNTRFIQQQLHPLFRFICNIEVLTHKIDNYIQKYLQASWAPVMSCLNNDTPHCFRKASALPQFDLEFQKIYTVHKLWKVPDPKLRTLMREAIIEQVVPGLTRFLQDNNITNPGVTPQEREEMLLELFEG